MHITVAAVANKFCSHLRRVSSCRTSTTGAVDESTTNGRRRKIFVSSVGWYLQHGSNCHDKAYKAAHTTLPSPRPMHDAVTPTEDETRGMTAPTATHPTADRTAVLCKQLPTRIQRDVSSPSCVCSIIITGACASRALSKSDNVVSKLYESDTTKQSLMSNGGKSELQYRQHTQTQHALSVPD